MHKDLAKPTGTHFHSAQRSDSSPLPDPTVDLVETRYELTTDMFLYWARRTPLHAAVSQGATVWTYSDLASRSSALARTLLVNGGETGDVVAVVGRRSFGLIASLMAVMLSRSVLLSIDRRLPA